MGLVTNQKDLAKALKRDTVLNFRLLSKRQAMPAELSRQLFEENALEKPTQSLFNHLSHYLVSVIDHAASKSLPWPLYDSKTERAYRNQLSSFITDCSNKGLLAPVMSSYLVNPGCFKVTKLLFQMSQLAQQRLLSTTMKKDSQVELYNKMTEKYKTHETSFVDDVEKKTQIIHSKFSNYLQKRKVMEDIAELLRRKITQMESKIIESHKFLNDLIDGYAFTPNLDTVTKEQILNIKNVNKPSQFFDNWLIEVDKQIDELESKWTEKVSPLLSLGKTTETQTEQLISRCTGEADKNVYMIEYNHNTDFICTEELQAQVNSEQQYVLTNIVQNEKLSFPNLIRGFVIAMSYVFKDVEIGDEIYKFNEYLDHGRMRYSELVETMKSLVERILNAEARLQPSPLQYHRPVTTFIPEIPPLPDVSELLNISKLQCGAIFDKSPPNTTKHEFNLHRKKGFNFAKPQPKFMLATTSSQPPKDDFLKSLISCRVSSYDGRNPNMSHNFHNLSIATQSCRLHESIAECSGFSKQQIQRLLSAKKSSSSKKYRHKTNRPNIRIKKGDLFNDSSTSNESNGLYRSYSSPNLYENREKAKIKERRLSIMKEDSLSLLEVSGIVALDKDNSSLTTLPKSDSSHNIGDMPTIFITPAVDETVGKATLLPDFNKDSNLTPKQKTETPKPNAQLLKKSSSSLEKIISRFKRVRASVIPEKSEGFVSLAEEKENNLDSVNVKRVLLPDLLSPSMSMLSDVPGSEYLDKVCRELDEKVQRKPRESLGTALGVDHTFLDQLNTSPVNLTED